MILAINLDVQDAHLHIIDVRNVKLVVNYSNREAVYKVRLDVYLCFGEYVYEYEIASGDTKRTKDTVNDPEYITYILSKYLINNLRAGTGAPVGIEDWYKMKEYKEIKEYIEDEPPKIDPLTDEVEEDNNKENKQNTGGQKMTENETKKTLGQKLPQDFDTIVHLKSDEDHGLIVELDLDGKAQVGFPLYVLLEKAVGHSEIGKTILDKIAPIMNKVNTELVLTGDGVIEDAKKPE